MKPLILTLTGPTCAGKSTLEDLLIERGFASVISTTTRPMRNGERDGADYYFTDHLEFDKMIDAGTFVEWVAFNGEFYGVTKEEIERVASQGKPIVIVCEPNGRNQVTSYCIAHDWNAVNAYVGGADRVIAERFIRRLVSEQFTPFNVEKLVLTYASRMRMIMTVERGWISEAYANKSPYHYTAVEFDESNQNIVINDLIEIAREHGYLRDAA